VSVVHVAVIGRVQGIGFRWFVRERATALNLAGWVRNLEDGSVEVAASGADAAISQFVAAVHKGPPGALVTHVLRLPSVAEELLEKPFAIMR
jgi:acylphosphatase